MTGAKMLSTGRIACSPEVVSSAQKHGHASGSADDHQGSPDGHRPAGGSHEGERVRIASPGPDDSQLSPRGSPEAAAADVASIPAAQAGKRVLELTRFSFVSIDKIDCPDQKYSAQIFFELRFRDGKLDPFLNVEGDEFPKPSPGQPPRPPAGWYKNQLDIKNFIRHNPPLNSNVVRQGNDIMLSLRYEGEFSRTWSLRTSHSTCRSSRSSSR